MKLTVRLPIDAHDFSHILDAALTGTSSLEIGVETRQEGANYGGDNPETVYYLTLSANE